MRIGFNPHRNTPAEPSRFTHQVVIPVFIPNNEGYFRDSFTNFKLCLKSLCETAHERTFITIVNNGSSDQVRGYIDTAFREKKIHEVIHSDNIGKMNAAIKGLSGHNIELVTIADSDVMFLSGWQTETARVFSAFPKAGVVGLTPQYKMFTYRCENLLIDKMFSSEMRFVPIANPDAMLNFYDSIGWGKSNPDYLKTGLGIVSKDVTAMVGSGHFVATYKRNIFDRMSTYSAFKLGGESERYVDSLALEKDYWRLTTHQNFAYHLGNTHEAWMDEIAFTKSDVTAQGFAVRGPMNRVGFFFKNRVFRKIFANYGVRRMFYRIKNLPSSMIEKY